MRIQLGLLVGHFSVSSSREHEGVLKGSKVEDHEQRCRPALYQLEQEFGATVEASR